MVASNDETLRSTTVRWDLHDAGIPENALKALGLNLAVHQSFCAAETQWYLICGTRGSQPFVLPELLDDWGMQIVQELAAHQTTNAPESHPLVLALQPIFSIALRQPTRVELFVRSLSGNGNHIHWPQLAQDTLTENELFEADRWCLSQALDKAGDWVRTYGIRKVHVNVPVYDGANLNVLLGLLSAAPPAIAGAVAFEIDAGGDFASAAFVNMARALSEGGAEVGTNLPDCTWADVVQLMRLPLTFMKIPVTDATGGWARSLPWEIFLTNVATEPYWRILDSFGASFAQGFGIEAPMSVSDFDQRMMSQARSMPAR